MALKLVTPPDGWPISEQVARLQCRIEEDDHDQDELLELMIGAAVGHVEKYLGRSLMPQTWDLFVDAFPSGSIKIPMGPIIEIGGVFYLDVNGDEQELADFTADLASEPGRITRLPNVCWPTTAQKTNSVRVRFTAGYPLGGSPPEPTVPKDIQAAILLTLGSLWEFREQVVAGQSVAELPWGAKNLLMERRLSIGMA